MLVRLLTGQGFLLWHQRCPAALSQQVGPTASHTTLLVCRVLNLVTVHPTTHECTRHSYSAASPTISAVTRNGVQ